MVVGTAVVVVVGAGVVVVVGRKVVVVVVEVVVVEVVVVPGVQGISADSHSDSDSYPGRWTQKQPPGQVAV